MESPTIRNFFVEMKCMILFYLKFPNSTMNYGNNKANNWCAEKLKHMPSICHYPKFEFIIPKKDGPNSLNNNLNKKFI